MLSNFHPRSAAIYLLVWFLLALFVNDLNMLLFMLGLLAIINYGEDKAEALTRTMKPSIPLALVIISFNILLAGYGETVVFVITGLPLTGSLTIYQEPLVNGTAMAIKLILMISIFTVFNQVITVDKLISVFGTWSGPAVVMAVLAGRMVPLLSRHARSIGEVQSLRTTGNKKSGLIDKIRSAGPFLSNLLRASLESSWQTAEAMQLRAYGSGPRTCFVPEKWQKPDTLITIISSSVLLLFFHITAGSGWAAEYGSFLLLFVLAASPLMEGAAT